MCLYCFASLQNSVHTRLMHPCIACPSRRTDYLHSHKHRQPRTIPRPAPHLAYERSVGFASLQNSGRSISGILARPLPKGAGLRQDSIVSNISIFSDPHNAPILQTISAARLRDRRHDYLRFHKHRQPRTIPHAQKTGQRFFHRYPVVIIDLCF